MPFVEGIHAYQNHTASNTQALGAAKESIRTPSSLASELTPGKVFEGTVTEMKNGQVTIGLSDGHSITARMESGVNLEKGQPMLFEVKSSSAEQIAIRPVAVESAQNPTLQKALEAAGLKVTPQNLTLVNAMMQEQLPVDRNSLLQMMRAMSSFPQAGLETLVQMQKAGLPLNEGMVAQFEAYKANEQSFLPQLQELMEKLPDAAEQMLPAGEGVAQGSGTLPGAGGQAVNLSQILGFQQQLVSILAGTRAEPSPNPQIMAAQTDAANRQVQQNLQVQNLAVSTVDAAEGVIIQQDITQKEGNAGQTPMEAGGSPMGHQWMGGQQEGGQQSPSLQNRPAAQQNPSTSQGASGPAPENLQTSGESPAGSPVSQVLDASQQQSLSGLLREFSQAAGNERLFPGGELNTRLSAGEMLQEIIQVMEQSENSTGGAVQKLLTSREYKGLLRQAMADQWLLQPEMLKEEGAVKELYQRLGRQMEQLQQALGQNGQAQSALAKTAQSVQGNLDFMNQLNQVYTYVQLPLKLANQNAHSDLYVYTNKKNLRDKEGELTALLHLDMEHLGSADIHIRMLGTKVETKFYLENELSFRLILGHSEELSQRLEKKGYHCEIQVENRKKQQDFVQEFLEQEKPAGKLQRYSFDVKA